MEQEFIENLHELDHKLNMIADQDLSEYPACQDIGSLLKKIKIKVCCLKMYCSPVLSSYFLFLCLRLSLEYESSF